MSIEKVVTLNEEEAQQYKYLQSELVKAERKFENYVGALKTKHVPTQGPYGPFVDFKQSVILDKHAGTVHLVFTK